jgi:hypothetical protein
MKTGKIIIGKVTFEDIMTANRKASREMNLDNATGWNSVSKSHKSVKDYTIKPKHKKTYSFE